jgi:hypothetical protein
MLSKCSVNDRRKFDIIVVTVRLYKQAGRQRGQAPSTNKDRQPDRQTGFANKQAGRHRGQAPSSNKGRPS